jgi:hypothetical protein
MHCVSLAGASPSPSGKAAARGVGPRFPISRINEIRPLPDRSTDFQFQMVLSHSQGHHAAPKHTLSIIAEYNFKKHPENDQLQILKNL